MNGGGIGKKGGILKVGFGCCGGFGMRVVGDSGGCGEEG